MSDAGRIHPRPAPARAGELGESEQGSPADAARDDVLKSDRLPGGAERTLLAREAALLARERAADQREIAADQRDQAAAQREANIRAEAAQRALGDNRLLEANENLIAAAIQSQTMTEAAEHTALRLALRADRDFLTGLPNRAVLTDRLAQSITLAQRHGKRVALMYLDFDNFKDINDSLGHSVGDLLLQSAAKRLRGCVRQSDTVSRQGGDEFIVLLSEIEAANDAALAAAKLVKVMAEPHLIGEHRLNVTMSVGIVVYPDDGDDADAILTKADLAMYHAKRHGRNNYQRFAPEMIPRP